MTDARDYRWQRWTDGEIESFIETREATADPDTEDLIMRMRDELENRDEYRANHADTPSLQDRGLELGDYSS